MIPNISYDLWTLIDDLSNICILPQIYDFNDDGEIDRTDLDELVNRTTGFVMATEDVDGIVDAILKECDMDENETITAVEFEDIIQKSPEFTANFNIEV